MQIKIMTACGGLVALGFAVLWAYPWAARQDALLAALEPASGAPAPAEGHGAPKKSHSGKVLSDQTLPLVTVGGRPVVSAQQLNNEERATDLGTQSDNDALKFKLQQQRNVRNYAHNPSRGANDALVQVYEFSDLSCVQCMKVLAEADRVFKENSQAVRQTQIHTPVSQFQDTNLAAFYGKVAQRGGKFWEYREALETLEDPTPEKYFEALLNVGVDRLQARHVLNTEARRLYRELDADAALAKSLAVGEPPAFVINGTVIGDAGVPRDQLATVFDYQHKQALRRQELARLNQPGNMGGDTVDE